MVSNRGFRWISPRVEEYGFWPELASTTMFVLDSQEPYLQEFIAYASSMVGVSENSIGAGVESRTEITMVGGTDGMVHACSKIEKNDMKANELDHGAVIVVVDLVKAFKRVKLEVVW